MIVSLAAAVLNVLRQVLEEKRRLPRDPTPSGRLNRWPASESRRIIRCWLRCLYASYCR